MNANVTLTRDEFDQIVNALVSCKIQTNYEEHRFYPTSRQTYDAVSVALAYDIASRKMKEAGWVNKKKS